MPRFPSAQGRLNHEPGFHLSCDENLSKGWGPPLWYFCPSDQSITGVIPSEARMKQIDTKSRADNENLS